MSVCIIRVVYRMTSLSTPKVEGSRTLFEKHLIDQKIELIKQQKIDLHVRLYT